MARGISFQEAAALAKQGDSDAQYALSSVLHERGQFDESLEGSLFALDVGVRGSPANRFRLAKR